MINSSLACTVHHTLSRLVYKRTTEWKKDDKLTKAIWKNSTSHRKRIEIERDKLVFWDDAQKLKVKGFPSSHSNWYFHPARFIEHLNKVAVPPEFNPYEGLCYDEIANNSISSSLWSPRQINLTDKIAHNPGFAPLWKKGSWTDKNPNRGGYACVTGFFNENYALVDSLDYKDDWSEYYHEGVDFRGTTGTVIHSFILGTVLAYGWFGTYGRTIFIARKKTKGIYLLAHLQSFDENISVGNLIKPLDVVGTVGGSGIKNGICNDSAWAPHLHITYFDYQYEEGEKVVTGNGGNITTTTAYNNMRDKKKHNPFIHTQKKLENKSK